MIFSEKIMLLHMHFYTIMFAKEAVIWIAVLGNVNIIQISKDPEESLGQVFALLGCYAAHVGSWLPMFQDSISVPSSRVKQSLKWDE